MKNKICEFVKTSNGNQTIDGMSIGPLSIYKKSRLNEIKLKVKDPEFTLETNFSFDLLYLVNYPSKEELKQSFIQESLLSDYYKDLITLSVISSILEGRIALFCSSNSFEFMNGLITENYDVFSLSRGTFDERDAGLMEKAIYNSLYTELENRETKIPLKHWVKILINQFLDEHKEYNSPYILIGKLLLKDTLKRFYWAQTEVEEQLRWKIFTRAIYSITIDEEMKISMRRDLGKQNERIQQGFKSHYLFHAFYQKLEKIIENEMRRREPTDG